ncbi:hypothetical protein MRX96_006439 [Rhipicephalus microplus]
MSGGAQRDAASVAAGVAAGGDAARSWRALHADLRPTGSSADTCAADLKKPSSWEPKPPPLPDADYKVILRIRGGLDCTKLHPCVLRQLVLKAVGLPISSPDQIRVNPTSHTVLVSTSSMDRADLYHNIRTLKFNGVPYEVVTHVADPVDSCRGRFHLPLDYADEEILPTLQRSADAPLLPVLLVCHELGLRDRDVARRPTIAEDVPPDASAQHGAVGYCRASCLTPSTRSVCHVCTDSTGLARRKDKRCSSPLRPVPDVRPPLSYGFPGGGAVGAAAIARKTPRSTEQTTTTTSSAIQDVPRIASPSK